MTPQEKRNATYQRNRQRREAMEQRRREEREATICALRYIRDSAEATPEEILEAVRRLEQMENRR